MGKNVLIFAGTTEGRHIANRLASKVERLYVSVATEYGRESICHDISGEIIWGRMDEEEMAQFLLDKKIHIVIDGTHPFAQLVTANIKKACKKQGVTYLRCLREPEQRESSLQGNENMIVVQSVQEAVAYISQTEGNVLITTGSKELGLYTKIPNYQTRCYARVLSVKESVEKAIALGFQGKHLIAMQGPFSQALNQEMIRHTDARYMVTKESGVNGGYEEKVTAASEGNCKTVVIRRPQEEGYSINEIYRLCLNII
ncbi:precorrin-6A/cobalt-precorrin-6A reductase [Aequitasia blattaphilus]|uniref:Precorrin-6A reductase n=1 Tax=Aequitasia blattaphilus TaxID=2949332 RepID=A0ABT1E8N7_9FIRM|nr:precorrin-6A reductase [Aequitasia blattaphilus]MCP1102181.1 precorrin-6A reductase [Aequitasia blattaphilus]MCR8614821.1 precorrin-6A reductase [Aequitasia blattaphilus]